MKKHLIIGNPVTHSLSPKIHNHWFNVNNIKGIYEKYSPRKNEIKNIIKKIKKKEIYGMNVTVPFKQDILPFLDSKSKIVKKTNSVNTVFKKNGKVYGDNTDVYGFKKSLLINKLVLRNKKVLILGAGGVVPSIIYGLKSLKVGKIFISNRTLKNAKKIKKIFKFIEIVEWGKIIDCDLYINSTSVGLKSGEKLNFNYKSLSGKKIFYDVIYNPSKTPFLAHAEKLGHKIINGREMFLYQAQKAFKLWHKLTPKIDKNLVNLLDND